MSYVYLYDRCVLATMTKNDKYLNSSNFFSLLDPKKCYKDFK